MNRLWDRKMCEWLALGGVLIVGFKSTLAYSKPSAELTQFFEEEVARIHQEMVASEGFVADGHFIKNLRPEGPEILAGNAEQERSIRLPDGESSAGMREKENSSDKGSLDPWRTHVLHSPTERRLLGHQPDPVNGEDGANHSVQAIPTSHHSFVLDGEVFPAEHPKESWYLKNFFLRIQGMVGFTIPGLLSIQVIPEVEMVFQRANPEGWTTF